MSQENVDVIRSMYEGFSGIAQGGDVASYIAAHYDPDCEYQPVEEKGTIRGHDALIRWNERWFDAWEEFGAEVDEIIEAGELVVTAITVGGHGHESGVEIKQRVFHVFEVRDGKILRMGEFLDRGEALEAAGLSE